ncbi:hypothetical protein [Pimelobacter sp. 30-1]|uniref:hypothetical protein n=1 Tax=Pimelobacter sp. 30-1 TaxID=2004991 RepID=UPI001C043D8D|nr:hypothetical protein [Pimelobacter sp. 30-1]
MKVAAIMSLFVGLMIGSGLALLPTSVSFLGSSGSCGPPVLRVLATEASTSDDFGIEQGLVDQCVQQSWVRLMVGGFLGGLCVIFSVIMFSLDRGRVREPWNIPPPGWGPPPPPPPPGGWARP